MHPKIPTEAILEIGAIQRAALKGELALSGGTTDRNEERLLRTALYSRSPDMPVSPGELQALTRGNKAGILAQPLTAEEYVKWVREVFAEIFRRPSIDESALDAYTTERVHAAWRIIREIAKTKKQLDYDEPLAKGLLAKNAASTTPLDPWIMPSELPDLHETRAYLHTPLNTANPRLLRVLNKALRIPEEKWCWTANESYLPGDRTTPECPSIWTRPGMPIMPPPVPIDYLCPDGTISEEYSIDQKDDPLLALYMEAVYTTAEYLGVWNGTAHDSDYGNKGMVGLTSAHLIRIAFPTRFQIIAYEYIVIDDILKQLVKFGHTKMLVFIQRKYGLNHIETLGLVSMARQYAKSMMNADREEDRAIMLLRCEEHIKRSRAALDLKSEMNAIKQMNAVLGLTRTENEGVAEDFVDIIKRATHAKKAQASLIPRPALDNKTITVEPGK